MIHALLITATLSLAAVQVEVETLDGQKVQGEVSSWTTDQVVVKTAEGEQTFLREKLLAVRAASEPKTADGDASVWMELTDGTSLVGTAFTSVKSQLQIELLNKQKLSVPASLVTSVRLKEQNETLAQQWEQIRGVKLTGDLIVIRKKQSIDFLEGVVGQVTEDKVHFNLDGDEIPVRREKVEGLIYYHSTTETLPKLVGIVSTSTGLRIRAKETRLDTDKMHVVSLAGLEFDLPWETIKRVDYSASKIQYLSDLKPKSVDWKPYFGLPESVASLAQYGRPRFDQSLEGGPLTLRKNGENNRREKVEYTKGLALLSRTEMVYRMPEGFHRLMAVVGIDARVGDAGNVRLVISGDSKKLLEMTVKGTDDPQPIDLDITGLRHLKILVDYGDDLDTGDYLDLCEARISK